jgi:hypothetical protein
MDASRNVLLSATSGRTLKGFFMTTSLKQVWSSPSANAGLTSVCECTQVPRAGPLPRARWTVQDRFRICG